MPGFTYPHIAGMDIAGTVEQVGSDVSTVEVGDRVVVDPSMAGVADGSKLAGRGDLFGELGVLGATADGGYAERCLAPASHVYPGARRHADRERGDLSRRAGSRRRTPCSTSAGCVAGESVLIHAAGAGVSVAAIQLAKHAGATVLATAGTDEKCERALRLGADLVLNNRTDDVAAWARQVTSGAGVRMVFDHVGTALFGPRCSPSGSKAGSSRVATRRAMRPRSPRSATCSTRPSPSRAPARIGPTSSHRRGAPSATNDSRWPSTRSSISPRPLPRRRRWPATTSSARSCCDRGGAVSDRRDAPYPQLKQTHTMAHTGRPWTDFKPPAAAPVWAAIDGFARYSVLCAALQLDIFDTLGDLGPATADDLADRLSVSAAASAHAARQRGRARPARPVRRRLRAQRHGPALPRQRRSGMHGRPRGRRPGTVGELVAAGRHGAPWATGTADRGRPGIVLHPPRRGHVHHDVAHARHAPTRRFATRQRRRRGSSTSARAARRGRLPC